MKNPQDKGMKIRMMNVRFMGEHMCCLKTVAMTKWHFDLIYTNTGCRLTRRCK